MRSNQWRARIKYLCHAAIIAAMYVILTILSAALGLASGPIQVRFSEALCVLPYFTSAAVPGLTVGCLLANIFTSGNILDIIFGTLATFIGAIGALLLKRYKYIITLPTIAANTLILPFVLKYMFMLNDTIFFLAATIFAGEFISAGLMGTVLLLAMIKRSERK